MLLILANEAVVTVLAAVDHTGFFGFGVAEDKELMLQQIHLQNGLLHRHGLDGEGLALFVLCKEWVENDGMDPSEELV